LTKCNGQGGVESGGGAGGPGGGGLRVKDGGQTRGLPGERVGDVLAKRNHLHSLAAGAKIEFGNGFGGSLVRRPIISKACACVWTTCRDTAHSGAQTQRLGQAESGFTTFRDN